MEGLKLIPYVALVIAIAGIIIGTAAISLAQFGDTVTKCFNGSWIVAPTGTHCINSSNTTEPAVGKEDLNFTTEYYAIYKSAQSQGELGAQLPTVAIIAIMVVIISIIAGVFVYLNFFRS